jgi:hypothetical protein
MADKKKVSGILISDAEGNLYNIPDDDLARFLVPKDKVEEVMIEAENAGLAAPGADEPLMASPAMHEAGSVINIFVGGGPAEIHTAEMGEVRGHDRGSTMAKYAGGSTMAKYAGGSTMAKYAGGSTMAKYAGGSTMEVTPYGRKPRR